MVVVRTGLSPNGITFNIEDLVKSYNALTEYSEEGEELKVSTELSPDGIKIPLRLIEMSYGSASDSIFYDLDFSEYIVFSVFYGDKLKIGEISRREVKQIIGDRTPINTVYDVEQSIHHVCYDYIDTKKSDRIVLSMEHPDRLTMAKSMRTISIYREKHPRSK